MKLNSMILPLIWIGTFLSTATACVDIDREIHRPDTDNIDFSVCILDNHDRTKALATDGNYVERYGNDVISVEVSPMALSTEELTKGSQISDIMHIGTSGIFAYYTQDAGSTFATYMDNQQVTYSVTDGTASYSPIRYWPVSDGTTSYLNFYGYSPYLTSGTGGTNGLLLTTSGTTPKVSYNTPSSAADQPDFMIAASQINKKKENPILSVPQNFRHALSCVGVQVYGNGQAIYSITLKGIRTKGEITLPSVTSSSPISWTLDMTTGDFNATINFDTGKPYIIVNPVTSDVISTSNYFMLLPQDLSDDAKLILDYEVIPESGDHTTQEISLKQGGLTAWEAGNCYNYEIIIRPFTHFSVTPAANEYAYSGGKTKYVVSSYYIAEGSFEKTPLNWTAGYVDWDDETTTEPTPDWLTLSNINGPGGFEISYDATIKTQISSSYSPEDNAIRAADEKVDYDLSESNTKTANCYIVNAAGTYKFPADVMGNGAAGWFNGAVDYAGNSLASASQTAINTSNSYAKLLWQDVPGAITELNLSGNYINFRTAPKAEIFQANASIAIVNKGADLTEGTSDDVIMWSWHIWITNINLASSTFEINFGTPHTMLNFPIGYRNPAGIYTSEHKVKVRFKQQVHLLTSPDVVISFKQNAINSTPVASVLYYQSGRKDPFVATKPYEGANQTMYDFDNNIIIYDLVTVVSADHPFTIGWGHSLASNHYNVFIKNPVLYQISNRSTWCTDINGKIATFWGAEAGKTIYDPSPYGYRVPGRYTFTGVTRASTNPADGGYNLIINGSGDTHFLPLTSYIVKPTAVKATPPTMNHSKNYIFLLHNANSWTYNYNNLSAYFSNSNQDTDSPGQAQSYGQPILPIKYITE